jgi:type IV pilus assembly protein PilV
MNKNLRKRLIKPRQNQAGVVLLESLIAVLIIAFGILGIIGLQSVSISAVSDARYRVEATALADELINQLWVDTTNLNALPSYANNSAQLPATWLARVNQLPGASEYPPAISSAANNVVTLTIFWKVPSAAEIHRHIIVTAINRNPP